MSYDDDLLTRLLEHAALHDQMSSPFDDEQARWAQDLRDAVAEIVRLRKAVLPEDD